MATPATVLFKFLDASVYPTAHVSHRKIPVPTNFRLQSIREYRAWHAAPQHTRVLRRSLPRPHGVGNSGGRHGGREIQHLDWRPMAANHRRRRPPPPPPPPHRAREDSPLASDAYKRRPSEGVENGAGRRRRGVKSDTSPRRAAIGRGGRGEWPGAAASKGVKTDTCERRCHWPSRWGPPPIIDTHSVGLSVGEGGAPAAGRGEGTGRKRGSSAPSVTAGGGERGPDRHKGTEKKGI